MRAGFALIVVLFAVSLGSALAVGGAYVTRQMAASARQSSRGLELEPHAEQTLVRAIADWNVGVRDSQAVGSVMPLPTISNSRVRVSAWITRTTLRQYWLVSESASDAKPLLRRRLGVLIRVQSGSPRVVSARAWADLP